MAVDWTRALSDRAAGLFGSMTRGLMHAARDPNLISFGGGLPAWDLFPVEAVREITDDILREDGAAVLQYGTSEGYLPLRSALADRLGTRGIEVGPEGVLIDTGSMQGIDLCCKLILNEGDTVLVGAPTFLTALQAFAAWRVNVVSVPLDEDGLQTDGLDALLSRRQPRLIYVMPNFQNPSGRTLGASRRRELVAVAARHGVPILEDDAYGELRYEGTPLPPLRALDEEDGVIYLGSFSKVLSPGLRVGYVVAPAAITEKLVFAKQAADLHTCGLSQRIAAEFSRRGLLDPHLARINAAYRLRRDAMLGAMENCFPKGVTWTRPEGGIFVWVTLPEGMDAAKLFERATEQKVVFVPGANYWPNGGGSNTMRLSFAAHTPDKVTEGIERLGRLIRAGV